MAQDLTTGKPGKVIITFALPLILGNLFQQLYNTADTLIVGRTVGTQALAAVGCTSSIFGLLLWFANGFTSGCMLVLAKRYGAKDLPGVRRSIVTSTALCTAIAAVITALGVPLSRWMLERMQTPENILDDATVYLQWIFAGTVASVAFNLISGLCRALGDSKTPLLFLAVGCVVNIGLDLLFILAFHMGVAGAALATVMSQVAAAVGCYFFAKKKFPVLKLSRADFRITGKEIYAHANLGFPMGFQYSIIAIGIIVLQVALNRLGDTAVAAYTAAGKVETFAGLPFQSIGVAVSNYAAQNYGAGNIPRIRQGLWKSFLINGAIALAMMVLNIVLGRWLMYCFVGNDPEVIDMGYQYLLILGVSYIFLATLYVFRSALQGLGKGLITTLAGIAELLMRFFGAIVMGNIFGFPGVCSATPLAWIGACVPLTVGIVLLLKELKKKEALQKQSL